MAFDTVTWQPFWNGTCVRLAQVYATFPSIQATGVNVISFALYADRGDLWPGALVKELGDMATVTTLANTGKTMAVDAPMTPHTVYWLAIATRGGTAPSVRTNVGASPLIALPDTDFVRTTAPSYFYNGFAVTATGGVFPAMAGNETVLTPVSLCPRIAWSGA